MNDLDDLKDAMHSPPDFEPRELDLGAVMAQGGRLRRRRRLAVGTTSAAAVLVLLVGGGQLARLAGEGGPTAPPAAARPTGAASAAPLTNSASTEPAGGILGDVMPTGLKTPGGDAVVLWFQRRSDAAVPDNPIALIAGRRTTGGALTSDVLANEVDGTDHEPGFHATEGPMVVNDVQTPAFGYYVGDAAKITVEANGRRVEAGLARWSDDPSIVAFWFNPAEVKPDATLTKLTAYGKSGQVLPGAGATFAVG